MRKPTAFLMVLCFLAFGVTSFAESPYLYGIHDHDTGPQEFLDHIGNGGATGWVTATVAIGTNPNDYGGADFSNLSSQGHTVIVRLNNGYCPTGTIPEPSKYADFAQRAANFVAASKGANIWIIGNETNLAGEWPVVNGKLRYISPQDYANCFRLVYNAIKQVRPNDKVISQALAPFAGPFNTGSTCGYSHDANPLNWVQYMNQMLTAIKSSGGLDGIALHINSRGYTYNDIHSTRKVYAGGQDLYFSFYVYKDWVDFGIPSDLYYLPLYATESNGIYYWSGGHPENTGSHYESGWVQEIYAEINRYNQLAAATGKPIFRCVNLYRWCAWCDGWNIDQSPYKGQILADLDQAVSAGYRWPQGPVDPDPPGFPSGENLALEAIDWSASSSYNNDFGGNKATDGNISAGSKWTSNGSSAISWLALDLGAVREISGFVVRHAGAGGEPSHYNTQSFRLASGNSLSGPWATLVTVDNFSGDDVSISVLDNNITARYVRLYITDAGIDNYARIPELEVYGYPQITLPPEDYNAEIVADDIPASMSSAEIQTISLTVKNTGANTWLASAGYRLGAGAQDNQIIWSNFSDGGYSFNAGDQRAFISAGDAVATGDSKLFNFSITAPTLPGTYIFSARMVRDGVTWFGDMLTATITVTDSGTTPSGNLIDNGDFEEGAQSDGIGSGWRPFSSAGYPAGYNIVGSPVQEGNYSQQIIAPQPSANDQFTGVYQSVSTAAGVEYTIGAWNRTSFSGGHQWDHIARLGIDPGGGTDFQAPSVNWYEFDSLKDAWHQLERKETATGSSLTIFLQSWRKWASGGDSLAWFDDVSVTAQDGPVLPGNRDPDAKILTSATGGKAPLAVSFDGSGSSDPDGDALSYGWDFGDGSQGSGAIVAHTYQNTGSYSAILTVSDGLGGSDTASVAIAVTGGDVPMPSYCPSALNFEEIRTQLNQQGQDLAHVKIGFHVGPGGNANGLGDWMRCLDAGGVPFFLKSADSAGQIWEASQIKAASGVPHVLVYRKSIGDGWDWDVPDYNKAPYDAAVEHWNRQRAEFPPELEAYKHLIWLETINEVDKNRSEWLGEFAYHTALIAMEQGFNWSAFGWSSGEPEREHWEGPWMQQFLSLAGQYPDRVALALHEYSYVQDNLDRWYPDLVGRFQMLYDVCDASGFPRPTVLVTEFGWVYDNIAKSVTQAMEVDLPWAAELYAQYPQVLGASIWYLGPGFGGIAGEAQPLIEPMTEYALQNYFIVAPTTIP